MNWMDSYPLLRPLLFALPPETAHRLALSFLARLPGARGAEGGAGPKPAPVSAPISVMGLTFANPVGLAAGFDKDGEAVGGWRRLGFGFVELGTVTPRPQSGNPRPRLFRLPEQGALINRMGFNNAGAEALARRLELLSTDRAAPAMVLGVSIGKNRDTPIERAAEDYVLCYEAVRGVADYIAVNLSSPNTPRLRQLERPSQMAPLLQKLVALGERDPGRRPPLVVKLSPDIEAAAVGETAAVLRDSGVSGVLIGNTTESREGVQHHRLVAEAGGLSGRPLFSKSTELLARFADALDGALPLIAAGGIDSLQAAQAKIDAGAALVQLYTGLVYQGPGLIRRLAAGLRPGPRSGTH